MNNDNIITAQGYHVPVLLNESVDALNIVEGGTYVDVTFGGGGHTRHILSKMDGNARLFSFDQDADAEENTHRQSPEEHEPLANDKRFTFVRSNFRFLDNWMRYYDVDHLDGIFGRLRRVVTPLRRPRTRFFFPF